VGALEEAVKYGRIELSSFFGLPLFEDLVQVGFLTDNLVLLLIIDLLLVSQADIKLIGVFNLLLKAYNHSNLVSQGININFISIQYITSLDCPISYQSFACLCILLELILQFNSSFFILLGLCCFAGL